MKKTKLTKAERRAEKIADDWYCREMSKLSGQQMQDCLCQEDNLCYNTNMPKLSILVEADNLVNQDRQEQYGSPVDNMRDIAELASRMINKDLTNSDIAMILLCVKLGRLKYQYKRDSVVDLCGYAEIYNRCKEGGANGPKN